VILWLYSQNQFQEDADGLLPEYMRRIQIGTYGSALLANIVVVNALMVLW
jgi:hypothetical protein